MVKRLIKRINTKIKRFQKDIYSTGLEAYVASNYPKSAADVDRLTREYEFKRYLSRMV